ncbi:MAG: Na+/H+ antiporter subunit E [Spirochaeta sp.]|nr:Na+/H+ antiporter subunit E [Spirochaeta sp.]
MKFLDIRSLKRQIIPFLLLLGFWLLLAPDRTPESIGIGILVAWGVTVFSKSLLFTGAEMPLYRLENFLMFLGYLVVLIIEIIKSNIDVARIVLSPKMPIQPEFIRVPIRIKNEVNRVILGNSITLTPGTLTVEITDEYCLVHALTKHARDALNDSFVTRWVKRIDEGLES